MAGAQAECASHGSDFRESRAESCGTFRIDDDGISHQANLFARPILEEGGGMQAVCEMIKLKVGSSLDSTIYHMVVLFLTYL